MPMKLCSAEAHHYDIEVHPDGCPFCADEGTTSDYQQEGAINSDLRPPPPTNRKEQEQGIGTIGIDLDKSSKGLDTDNPFKDPTPNPPEPDNGDTLKTRVMISGINSQDENDSDFLPTVGWLVIVAGPGKGRDFRLIQGANRIGRDTAMEVCLDFGKDIDDAISRKAHAMVVYDSNSNSFFIERGQSRNLPMINGNSIRGTPDLVAGDTITLGTTSLLFVPLCQENFHW